MGGYDPAPARRIITPAAVDLPGDLLAVEFSADGTCTYINKAGGDTQTTVFVNKGIAPFRPRQITACSVTVAGYFSN